MSVPGSFRHIRNITQMLSNVLSNQACINSKRWRKNIYIYKCWVMFYQTKHAQTQIILYMALILEVSLNSRWTILSFVANLMLYQSSTHRFLLVTSSLSHAIDYRVCGVVLSLYFISWIRSPTELLLLGFGKILNPSSKFIYFPTFFCSLLLFIIIILFNHRRLSRLKRALSSILINVLKCLKNTYFVCYFVDIFIISNV